MNHEHVSEVQVGAVGGLLAIAHFAHTVEPLLADVSYAIAIVVGAVTIFQKFRNRK